MHIYQIHSQEGATGHQGSEGLQTRFFVRIGRVVKWQKKHVEDKSSEGEREREKKIPSFANSWQRIVAPVNSREL